MKRVLFVDVRNAVRSPMAEAWFNRLARDWGRAYSCGTMIAERVEPFAVQAMAQVGMDLCGYVPKALTQQMLANSDIVVILGEDIFPQAFALARIWNFQDPVGRPFEAYQALRDAIGLRVEELIREIHQDSFEPYETDWQIPLLFHQHMTLNNETLKLLGV